MMTEAKPASAVDAGTLELIGIREEYAYRAIPKTRLFGKLRTQAGWNTYFALEAPQHFRRHYPHFI